MEDVIMPWVRDEQDARKALEQAGQHVARCREALIAAHENYQSEASPENWNRFNLACKAFTHAEQKREAARLAHEESKANGASLRRALGVIRTRTKGLDGLRLGRGRLNRNGLGGR